jgi:signal transduction histidine kinase
MATGGVATASVISLRPGASASLISQAAEKVVRLRPANEPNTPVLTPGEANAFHELTRQLTERLRAAAEPAPQPPATLQATHVEQTQPCRDREAPPAPMARAEDPDLRTTLEGAVEARRRAEQISAVKSDLMDRFIGEIRGALDAGASAGSLRSLIDDLDHLVRAASGKARLARTEIALNPLMQRCVADMQPRANRERVIIRSSLSASLPPVVVDQRTMEAMLIELLARSLDHAGSGRLVTLSTGTGEAGQVALRLRGADGGPTDTGRVPRDLERDLAVARALAQAIGASLTLNRTHGTGTLVEVMFPPSGAP